jgi:predicted GNAT superfamily acetyltransferase
MNFTWIDYNPATMEYIENWLDADAVRSTGLDEGFRTFYEYWVQEDGYVVGENFWCKVVCEQDEPVAVIAFTRYENVMTIMEIVVAPEKRGQGRGTKLLSELFESEEVLGFSVLKSEAVIFPSNIGSRKAFENAGFQHHHTYDDGSAMLYAYEQ